MKKPAKKFVACDIDHTISGAWHRDHLLGDWIAYYVDQEDDPPIAEGIALIRGLAAIGYEIVGLTAREEKYRAATTRWLVKHDVPIDEILMRPRGDLRPSPALKLGLLQLRFPGFAGVAMVIEDRSDIVEAFIKLGLNVVQMHAQKRLPEKK